MRKLDKKMRPKIFDALLNVINEEGLSGVRIAKLSKLANISPATIYIYFKNKDDILEQLFDHIQKLFLQSLFEDVNTELEVKETFQKIWMNYHQFIIEHSKEYFFAEEIFHNIKDTRLGFIELLSKQEILNKLLENAKDENLISNLDLILVSSLFFSPLITLSKLEAKTRAILPKNHLDTIFNRCWKSIS